MSSDSGNQKAVTTDERVQKKLNWYKWLIGTVVAIFVAGFLVSERVQTYATKTDVSSSVEKVKAEDEKAHVAIDARFQKVESRTVRIYGEQRASGERQKLIQVQLELLAENMAATPSPSRARALRQAVNEQSAKVVEVEKRTEKLKHASKPKPVQEDADPLEEFDDL